MANAAQDQQQAQYTAALMADPRVQQAVAAYNAAGSPSGVVGHGGAVATRSQPYRDLFAVMLKVWPEIAAANGINASDWRPSITPNGPSVEHQSWIDKHGTTAAQAAIGGVGAGAALGAFGGVGSTAPAASAGGSATAPIAAGAGGSMASKILPLLGVAGKAAGAAGAAQANNRAAEADYGLTRDELELRRQQAITDQQRLDLEQRKYRDQRYAADTAAATKGGYLQGVQDLHITRPDGIPTTTVTGGLRPSAIVGAKDIGEQMQRRALISMMNPDALPPITPVPPLSDPAQLQAGGGEKAMNALALIGGGASLFDDLWQNRPKRPLPVLSAPSTPYSGVDHYLARTSGASFY